MSDHHVGISVEQFCACDQSCGCFSGLQSQSHSPVAPLTTALFLSLKHGYERGILSCISVHTLCRSFVCTTRA